MDNTSYENNNTKALVTYNNENRKVLACETRVDLEIQKLYMHNTKEDVQTMETLAQSCTAS